MKNLILLKKYFVLIIFSMIFLTGCTNVTSTVTVFHQIVEMPPLTTYAFLPFEGQDYSLEYKTYSNFISQKLINYNCKEVDQDDNPDVLISFSYNIGNGREKVYSRPVYGQTGVSSSRTYGTLNSYGNFSGTTVYTPTYGIVGSKVVSKTIYDRNFEISAIDAYDFRNGKIHVLYEAKVKSSGSSSELLRIMPYMIESLFKEFPGESGSVRVDRIIMR